MNIKRIKADSIGQLPQHITRAERRRKARRDARMLAKARMMARLAQNPYLVKFHF